MAVTREEWLQLVLRTIAMVAEDATRETAMADLASIASVARVALREHAR